MSSKKLLVSCPICKVLVEQDHDDFPFCSPRCKTTDLGNWASGAYCIPDRSISELDDDNDKVIH